MIAEQTSTTTEVAARFNELAKEGKWDQIQNELLLDLEKRLDLHFHCS